MRDQRGLAAIEFALIAPVLTLLLLAMADIVPTEMVRQKVFRSTQAISDLTSQYSQLQVTDVVNIFSASNDLLAPFPTTGLQTRITSVYSDGNGHALVHWSCATSGMSPLPARSAITSTPTGNPVGWFLWQYNTSSGGYTLNGTNTSYIFVESQYVYNSPIQFIFTSPIIMSNVSYALPRNSIYVGFPWDGVQNDSPKVPNTTTTTASVTLSNGAICSYAN
jgi:Flp pilus assembly protein TadG